MGTGTLRARIQPEDIKTNVAPAGAINGSNTVFTAPDKFLEDTLQVFFNTSHLTPGVGCDYVMSESGGAGTGFDTVTLDGSLVPIAGDVILFAYVVDSEC